MQLNIPSIGTQLQLLQDWVFPLFNERRNRKFWEAYFAEPCPSQWGGGLKTVITKTVTLPAGAILTADRIYVRKGFPDFDSITFNLAKKINPFKTNGRFWVKLTDANRMDVQVV